MKDELIRFGVTRELKVVLTRVKRVRKRKPKLNTFIQLDERRKTYTCYVCMAKYDSHKDLDDHKKVHDSDAEDDTFEETYPTQETTEEAPSNSKRILTKQSVSGAAAENTKETTEPVKSQSNCDKKATPFRCDTCNMFFESTDDAKVHISSSKCKFSCRLCNRKFNTLYAFVVHVMQHRSNSVKNQTVKSSGYSCQSCDKSFDDCFQLKRHEVITHNIKSNSASYQPLTRPSEPEEPRQVAVQEMDDNADTPVDTSITCELCYDVFSAREELDKHMDFHKQLEQISEAVVMDEEGVASVEVVEDKKDKHEIVANIRKARPKKPPNTRGGPVNVSLNKVLADTIKEMLRPSSEKVSKTILLPEALANEHKGRRASSKFVLKKAGPLEVQQTGPTSYSVNYKDKAGGSASVETPAQENCTVTAVATVSNPVAFTPNTSTGIATLSSFTTTTQATSSINLASPGTQFAYVIIPHQTATNTSSVSAVSSPVNALISALTKGQSATVTNSFTLPTISNVTSLAASEPTTELSIPTLKIVDQSKDSVGNVTGGEFTFNYNPVAFSSSPQTSSSNLAQTSVTSQENSAPESSSAIPVVLIESSSEDEEFTEEVTSKEKYASSEHIGDLIIDETPQGQNSDDEVVQRDAEPNQSDFDDAMKESEAGGADENASDISDSSEGKKDDSAEPTIKGGTISVRKLEDLMGPSEPGSSQKSKRKRDKWKFPMKCDTCSVIFNRYRTYRLHNQRKHVCFHCDYKCCKTTDLKSHYHSQHGLYPCWRCEFLTDSQKDLQEHRKSHICRSCDGMFSDLSTHVCKKVITVRPHIASQVQE